MAEIYLHLECIKLACIHSFFNRFASCREKFGDTLVEAYAGEDYGVQTMKASEWEPFIRTMPHSEFPSASSCICQVRVFTGTRPVWFGRVCVARAWSFKRRSLCMATRSGKTCQVCLLQKAGEVPGMLNKAGFRFLRMGGLLRFHCTTTFVNFVFHHFPRLGLSWRYFFVFTMSIFWVV